MEFLKPEDQKLVPIPVVENIIREIHEINANIHRLNSQAPMEISSPPRLVETKKSQSRYYESPVRRGRGQDDVAIKLVELHDKVNKVLSRSGSPMRRSYAGDLKHSYTVQPRAEEAYKSSHNVRIHELHNQIDKVLVRSRSGSPARVAHEVEESIVLTRTGEPVRTSGVTRLNPSLRHSSVTRSPAYAHKVETFSTYANTYDRETVKRAAAQTPVRARGAYEYASPLKASGTSITRIASIPLYEYDRRSSLNSTAITASPSKLYSSGNYSTYSNWPSSAGPKYDHTRVNDAVNKILARKAVESAGIGSGSGLGRRGSGYTATVYQPTSSYYVKRY